tara:strand:+ start:95 stop:229 length:135 start_codon:yes stop_codon:yes gene_type:complete
MESEKGSLKNVNKKIKDTPLSKKKIIRRLIEHVRLHLILPNQVL